MKTFLTVVLTVISVAVLYLVWMFFLSPGNLLHEMRVYEIYAKDLQKDLQFTHGSPYCTVGDSVAEVFTLHPESESSPLAKAGVISGDIVFDDFSICGFYEELQRFRGKVFRFRVVSGGDGPGLRERPQKIINIYVPNQKQ